MTIYLVVGLDPNERNCIYGVYENIKDAKEKVKDLNAHIDYTDFVLADLWERRKKSLKIVPIKQGFGKFEPDYNIYFYH